MSDERYGHDPNRKALHAYLSDDAHDTWHRVAAESGVSVSALLEVLATELGSTADGERRERSDQIVRSARKIDAERRRRS